MTKTQHWNKAMDRIVADTIKSLEKFEQAKFVIIAMNPDPGVAAFTFASNKCPHEVACVLEEALERNDQILVAHEMMTENHARN